ncbi:MAG: hypothetical protein QOD07_1355, partial [Frankiaceae bacterium]|nr:hypothetical protein [Frankiaceae bacterium]
RRRFKKVQNHNASAPRARTCRNARELSYLARRLRTGDDSFQRTSP